MATVVTGDVYYNEKEDTYQIGPCSTCVRFTGNPFESNRVDGNTYRISASGWINLGKTAALQMPFQNLPPEVISQMEREGAAIYDAVGTFISTVSPDYARFNFSVPIIFNADLTVSRDLRVYWGGGFVQGPSEWKNFISQASDFSFLEGRRNIGFRVGFGASLGWNLRRNMLNDELHDSLNGMNVTGTASLATVGLPFSVGYSQSIPTTGDSPFYSGPGAVEIGSPTNAGISVTSSTMIFDFGAYFRDQLERQRRGDD